MGCQQQEVSITNNIHFVICTINLPSPQSKSQAIVQNSAQVNSGSVLSNSKLGLSFLPAVSMLSHRVHTHICPTLLLHWSYFIAPEGKLSALFPLTCAPSIVMLMFPASAPSLRPWGGMTALSGSYLVPARTPSACQAPDRHRSKLWHSFFLSTA